jgi:quercetin dioxygenase-like cupin family protein
MSGFLLPATGGETYLWHGAQVTIKASGRDTSGQLAVMESVYPVGLSVPSHVHEGEDEMFYLLEGKLEGFCEDHRWVAGPGDFVFVPRDRRHGFVVADDMPARALVIVGPPNVDSSVVSGGERIRAT